MPFTYVYDFEVFSSLMYMYQCISVVHFSPSLACPSPPYPLSCLFTVVAPVEEPNPPHPLPHHRIRQTQRWKWCGAIQLRPFSHARTPVCFKVGQPSGLRSTTQRCVRSGLEGKVQEEGAWCTKSQEELDPPCTSPSSSAHIEVEHDSQPLPVILQSPEAHYRGT